MRIRTEEDKQEQPSAGGRSGIHRQEHYSTGAKYRGGNRLAEPGWVFRTEADKQELPSAGGRRGIHRQEHSSTGAKYRGGNRLAEPDGFSGRKQTNRNSPQPGSGEE